MFSPEWVAVGLTVAVQLAGVGVMYERISALTKTSGEHARKIDRTEKAVILITPERQRAEVIQIFTQETAQ